MEDDFTIVELYGKGFTLKNKKGENCFGVYDKADNFEQGIAKVEKDGKTYAINKKGDVVTFLNGFDSWDFSTSKNYIKAISKTEQHVAYFRIDGSMICETFCDPLLCTNFNIHDIAFINGKIVNSGGEVVGEIPYQEIIDLNTEQSGYQHSFAVRQDGKWIKVSYDGQSTTPMGDAEKLFTDWGRFTKEDGSIEFIRINGIKHGPYIDYDWKTGEYDTPSETAPIRVYDSSTKKYGFINEVGKLIIPFNYDKISPFYSGCQYAEVYGTKEKHCFFKKKTIEVVIYRIDKDGNKLV